MLYTLTPAEHDPETIVSRLAAHPEVKFVSFTGVDMGGHNTDEKIPVQAFTDDMEKLLANGFCFLSETPKPTQKGRLR